MHIWGHVFTGRKKDAKYKPKNYNFLCSSRSPSHCLGPGLLNFPFPSLPFFVFRCLPFCDNGTNKTPTDPTTWPLLTDIPRCCALTMEAKITVFAGSPHAAHHSSLSLGLALAHHRRHGGPLPTVGWPAMSSPTVWPRRRLRAQLTASRTRSGGRLASHASPEGSPRAGPERRPNRPRLERRYRPPGVPGLCRKTLRKVQKPLAGSYYQLPSGHAATGSICKRMTGPLRRELSECRWCGSGRRGSRHHLFTECQAWVPQIRKLGKRVGKDCGQKHPKALAVRKLWKERATEAVLELLEDAPVGHWLSAGVARAPRVEGVGEGCCK